MVESTRQLETDLGWRCQCGYPTEEAGAESSSGTSEGVGSEVRDRSLPSESKEKLHFLFSFACSTGDQIPLSYIPGPLHHFYFDFTILFILGLTKVPLNSFCSSGRHVTCDPPASAS